MNKLELTIKYRGKSLKNPIDDVTVAFIERFAESQHMDVVDTIVPLLTAGLDLVGIADEFKEDKAVELLRTYTKKYRKRKQELTESDQEEN